jgi:hypothetical protein
MRVRVIAVIGVAASVATIVGNANGASRPTPNAARAGGHASRAAANGSGVLLFANSDNDAGIGVSSQNFESQYAAYNSAAADDFFVPANTTWHVTVVDVNGVFYNGSGPDGSETESVTFYKNTKGVPGLVKATYTLQGLDNSGSFAITLPGKGITLKGGRRGKTFWLSVAINMPFHPNGQWAWETSTNAVDNTNVWENPSNGYGTGCTTWTVLSSCFAGEGQSQMFALLGTHNP